VLKIAQSSNTVKICQLGITKRPTGHVQASGVFKITQSSGTLEACLLGEKKTPKGNL